MKKSGLLIRAAIPVFALLGVLGSGSETIAYDDGKRVFKWLETSSDVTVGYRNDQLKFVNRATPTWFDVYNNNFLYGEPVGSNIGAFSQPFVSREIVRSRQDLVQARLKETLNAVDGALTNSFLEAMADIAFPVSESKSYQGHGLHDGMGVPFDQFRPRFSFRRNGDHGHNGHHDHGHHHHDGDVSGDAQAFDAHIMVGYDIAKLKNPWKDFAFKPFVGYYWMRQKSSRTNIRGFHRPDVGVSNDTTITNAFGVQVPASYGTRGYPSRATVQHSAKWSGMFGGFIAESTWGNHTLSVRPEYRCVHTAKLFTQTRIHSVTPKYKVKIKRGKKSHGWNLGGGYKYQIDPDWALLLDGAWSMMVSKRPKSKEWVHIARVEEARLRSYNFNAGVRFSY